MRGPSFPGMRKSLGPYLVDKTALIEKIVITGLYQRVDLVLRPRRCGKSCMLHMLRCDIPPSPLFNFPELATGRFSLSENPIRGHFLRVSISPPDLISAKSTWGSML